MALESDNRYEQSAADLEVAAPSGGSSVLDRLVRKGKALLDSAIRISITVAACLLLIKLVDIISLRLFGHGAW